MKNKSHWNSFTVRLTYLHVPTIIVVIYNLFSFISWQHINGEPLDVTYLLRANGGKHEEPKIKIKPSFSTRTDEVFSTAISPTHRVVLRVEVCILGHSQHHKIIFKPIPIPIPYDQFMIELLRDVVPSLFHHLYIETDK